MNQFFSSMKLVNNTHKFRFYGKANTSYLDYLDATSNDVCRNYFCKRRYLKTVLHAKSTPCRWYMNGWACSTGGMIVTGRTKRHSDKRCSNATSSTTNPTKIVVFFSVNYTKQKISGRFKSFKMLNELLLIYR